VDGAVRRALARPAKVVWQARGGEAALRPLDRDGRSRRRPCRAGARSRSGGQRNDIALAHDLIDGFVADVTIADKGYDADHLCEKIAETGGQPVIPPKRNRTFKRAYDVELYKERNIIERFFNKLKQFRRVATRYDKLLKNFMGFVKLAAIAICLKQLNRHYDLGVSL
jgi:putative transposase